MQPRPPTNAYKNLSNFSSAAGNYILLMRYQRLTARLLELMFIAEALLQFAIQWRQFLAWMNPLLLGIGFASLARLPARPDNRRVGVGAITVGVLLLCYRLTRF
jgi:hypothetical protein